MYLRGIGAITYLYGSLTNFHNSTVMLKNVCTHWKRIPQYFRNNKSAIKMQKGNRFVCFLYDGRLFIFQGLFGPAHQCY